MRVIVKGDSPRTDACRERVILVNVLEEGRAGCAVQERPQGDATDDFVVDSTSVELRGQTADERGNGDGSIAHGSAGPLQDGAAEAPVWTETTGGVGRRTGRLRRAVGSLGRRGAGFSGGHRRADGANQFGSLQRDWPEGFRGPDVKHLRPGLCSVQFDQVGPNLGQWHAKNGRKGVANRTDIVVVAALHRRWRKIFEGRRDYLRNCSTLQSVALIKGIIRHVTEIFATKNDSRRRAGGIQARRGESLLRFAILYNYRYILSLSAAC